MSKIKKTIAFEVLVIIGFLILFIIEMFVTQFSYSNFTLFVYIGYPIYFLFRIIFWAVNTLKN